MTRQDVFTVRRGIVAFVLFVSVLVPVRAGAQTATINPGDFMGSSVGGCTLGFVYNGTGGDSGTYFGTAAHCVDSVGEDIRLSDGTVFADVAAMGNPDATAQDWALIRVRPAFVSQVRPGVRGISGAPSGVATTSHTSTLDLVRFSGHGMIFNLLPLTREQRVGLLVSQDNESYTAIGLDTFGDSGGPVVHGPSNRALGVVSRLCIGLCTSEGPTVQGVIAKAAAAGLPVSLRIA